MASKASARRPRPSLRRPTAVTLALGTFGALVAAAPPGAGDAPRNADHGFRARDLVSDIPGRAEKTDPNLVNPWGLARTPAGENFVSDNGSDKATTYSGALDNQPVNILPQVVSIPEGGAPTGVVRNDTDAFRFTDSGTGKSGGGPLPTPLQRRSAAQTQEDQRESYPVDEYRISTAGPQEHPRGKGGQHR
ncbi:hypothetical protein ACFWIZ_02990 [Streptomyces sp. NPDC127044]